MVLAMIQTIFMDIQLVYAHIELLFGLRKPLPVKGVDQKHNAVHGGKIIFPQLARRLVPSKIESLEADLGFPLTRVFFLGGKGGREGVFKRPVTLPSDTIVQK